MVGAFIKPLLAQMCTFSNILILSLFSSYMWMTSTSLIPFFAVFTFLKNNYKLFIK